MIGGLWVILAKVREGRDIGDDLLGGDDRRWRQVYRQQLS